jgi:F0F1-type ATP synthase membrane subunit c/vacuolar-type H+-ATPase subunit K
VPVVTCPKCPTKLRVADTATGNVKCPKCGTMFPVAQTPPKPQPKPAFEVVDDAPPKAPAPPKSATSPRATPPAPAPAAPGGAGNPFSFDEPESKPRKKKSVFDDAGDDEPAPARDEDEPPPRKKARVEEDEKPRARKSSDGGSKWGGTDDEEEDDRPRKKKRRDDDDDEDDRPRSKKRRYADDDDDEDDRPRKKKRRDDDDDDDEDERPRSKSKKRRYADEDDDEDDEDWHSSPKKKKKGAAGFGNAKVGVLLLNISFWLYGASLALIAFFIFLAWTGAFDRSTSSGTTTVRRTNNRGGFTEETTASNNTAELVPKLIGTMGICNWVVAGIGFGFCIAGPQRSRGMAIAAASLAAGHLVLAGISINNLGGLTGGLGAGGGTMILWVTTLPILDTLLPIIIMDGTRVIGSDYVFALLAAGCELARLICAMLMVKAIAAAARDHDAEEKAQFGVMGAAGVVGASAILGLVVALLFKAEAIKSISTLMNVTFGTILLIYIGFTAMTIMPIWATHGLRATLARRAR